MELSNVVIISQNSVFNISAGKTKELLSYYSFSRISSSEDEEEEEKYGDDADGDKDYESLKMYRQ